MMFKTATLLTVVLAGMSSLGAESSSTNSGSNRDFSSFRVIADKNIFNQSRYARSTRSETREPRSTSAPSDVVQLTGTLSYEKGDLAFFEGTRSDYRRAARVGDKLAGFSIASIRPAGVVLVTATNKITLPVGMQMRRHGEEDWEVGERTDTGGYTAPRVLAQAPPQALPTSTSTQDGFNPPPGPMVGFGEMPPGLPPGEGGLPPQPAEQTGETTSPTPAPAAASPAPAGPQDEVLRRMMQRREQEINR